MSRRSGPKNYPLIYPLDGSSKQRFRPAVSGRAGGRAAEIGLQGEAACGKGVSHLNGALQSSNVEAAQVAKPPMNPLTPMRTQERTIINLIVGGRCWITGCTSAACR